MGKFILPLSMTSSSNIIERPGRGYKDHFKKIQQELFQILQKPGFRDALEKTLKNAVTTAKETLHENVYNGLNNEHNGKAWPTTVENWCGIGEYPIDGTYFKYDCEGMYTIYYIQLIFTPQKK